ncbi:nuclease [Cellulomonas sp. ICMP 17802]|uniref:nuclease n=1 Tax=Cellulomonas sp. ICMP 17802 TaxID=3239199 RepID=UPI00351AFA2F
MPNRTRIDLLPIQEAVATASPGAWRDGLVAARDADTVTVALLDGHEAVLGTRAAPAVGEPVAVHLVAEIVALGGAWYAARPVVR